MNKIAFLTTEFAIKTLYDISKAKINLNCDAHLPDGSIIFVVNHFTRIETVFLPFHLQKITEVPVWSLADSELFKGFVGEFISQAGAVSTADPDRDTLMVKSLLTGEANWIIFPEGLMVKNKKLMEKGEFVIGTDMGLQKPHTGAGTLGLRTEFYRERLRYVAEHDPDELKQLLKLFDIESVEPVLDRATYIVPVNITYYPIRTRENILSRLAGRLVDNPSDRMIEEIMTEGTMLLSGVDVDIRFDEPIKIRPYMKDPVIQWDIESKKPIRFNDPIASKEILKNSSRNIMHGYMTSIYNMTTVNHDHLFASILYRMNQNRISIEDLKNRVFLAASNQMGDDFYYKHKSMESNQIHLLTDDRYGKFENFISFAIEKDLLQLEDEKWIVKNQEAFTEDTDFHSVRAENPLIVMANEVEPLTTLQYNIQLLAAETPENIIAEISGQLMESTVRVFEEDYEEFFLEGESKGKEIGVPYLIDGLSDDTGILLIHGYMAAPEEVRGLADYLATLGYCVYAPRLRGHGTSPEDLAERSYLDWIESVEEGYIILKGRCRRVIAGGFSTGAGLALDLALRVNDLAGVFAVAPPLKLNDFSAKFIPVVNVWNQLMRKFRWETANKEFIENSSENPHINYERNPISSIRELERLMDELEGKLREIKVPALVLQSRRDPVVNVKGTRRVFELLGSENKEYHLFNLERHGILLNDGAERVYKTIADFLETL